MANVVSKGVYPQIFGCFRQIRISGGNMKLLFSFSRKLKNNQNKLGCARVELQVYLTILEMMGDCAGESDNHPGDGG